MDDKSLQSSSIEQQNITAHLNRGSHKGILVNIIIVEFFYRIFEEGFRVLLIPYAYDVKGWSNQQYGLLISIGGYTAMAIVFFLGIIVDIQFKKNTMIMGLFAIVISAVAFTRVNHFALSVTFYCFFALGQELMLLSVNTFIANETRKGQHRTFGFTGNLFFKGIASAFAPILCMSLLTIPILTYNWVFSIMGIFGLIALILVFVLRLVAEDTPREEIKYAEELSKNSGDEYAKFSDDKKGKWSIFGVQASFIIGRMFMGFASGLAINFVNVYIYNNFKSIFDANLMAWAWVNSLYWIAITLGYIPIGYLGEKIGKEIIITICWTLVIPAALGIMLAGNAGMFYLTIFFFILRYVFAMSTSATWQSFTFEWIPPKHRGKTLGFIETGQRGMKATGVLIGGYTLGILGAAIFPIAMTAYPFAGLIPLIISKLVKKRLKSQCLKEGLPVDVCEEKISLLEGKIDSNNEPMLK